MYNTATHNLALGAMMGVTEEERLHHPYMVFQLHPSGYTAGPCIQQAMQFISSNQDAMNRLRVTFTTSLLLPPSAMDRATMICFPLTKSTWKPTERHWSGPLPLSAFSLNYLPCKVLLNKTGSTEHAGSIKSQNITHFLICLKGVC